MSDLSPEQTLLAACALPGCWAAFEQTSGRGRPRRYCSDEHRRKVDTMRKRTLARLDHMREQVCRDEHLLAALGGAEDEQQNNGGDRS